MLVYTDLLLTNSSSVKATHGFSVSSSSSLETLVTTINVSFYQSFISVSICMDTLRGSTLGGLKLLIQIKNMMNPCLEKNINGGRKHPRDALDHLNIISASCKSFMMFMICHACYICYQIITN